jgi:hypothetical protein
MKQTFEQLESKKKWRRNNPDKAKELARRSQRVHLAKMKNTIYDHYGRVCACCGENQILFLTIGHADGSGAEHRRQLLENQGRANSANLRAGATMAVYRDIIKRGFPDNIRIECMNCNCGAFRNGGVCPHVTMGLAKEQPGRPAEKQVPNGTAAS